MQLLIKGDKEIKALKVECTNEKDGCNWTNDLRYLEDHLKSCDYVLVSCDNECKVGDNITKFSRKDLAEHLANKCPKRQYECPHCQERGEYQDMAGPHLDSCPNVSTDCPNEGCHKRFPRINATSHAEVCDYQPVTCKYAEVGCTKTLLRKDLKKHEEDNQIHLQITTENTLKLQQQIRRMELRINQLEHKQYTFKIASFKELKREDKSFSSPLYYIKGYKMNLGIYANGDREPKGTHISVYAYLRKGKFDDYLAWPFTGTVLVEILNHLEDKNHYKKILTFPPDNDASKRVESGRGTSGWGYSQFIPHTELEYKSDKNCQYLKDDILVFRVSVDIPDYKPWLDVTVLPTDYK